MTMMAFVDVFQGETTCPEDDCYFHFRCLSTDEGEVARIMERVVELHRESTHPDTPFESRIIAHYDRTEKKLVN